MRQRGVFKRPRAYHTYVSKKSTEYIVAMANGAPTKEFATTAYNANTAHVLTTEIENDR